MNAAYYARYSRAVVLAGLERNLSPLEISILLACLDEEERGTLTVDRLTALLGMQAHPGPELRGLSIAGLVDVERFTEDVEVKLTARGQLLAAEIRAALTDQLQRWSVAIQVAWA